MSDDTEPDTVFFQVKVAHYFILGCALFSIFWGVINAILVSSHHILFFIFSWYNRLKKSKFQKTMMALGNISKKYVLLKQEGILATQKLLPKSWTKWYSSPEKLLR